MAERDDYKRGYWSRVEIPTGWWMAERDDFKRGYWSRVEIPTRMQIFFLLIFCIQID